MMQLKMLVPMGLVALVLTGCGQAEGSADAPVADTAAATATAEKPTGGAAATPSATADVAAPSAPATAAVPAPQRTAGYTPVPISADDQPGRARQIRCQVGTDPETGCTFTPLFGDGSFQLDGPDIAYRLVISDGEGGLFAVIGQDDYVPIGGTYRRDTRDRACWIANEETPAPSRICAR